MLLSFQHLRLNQPLFNGGGDTGQENLLWHAPEGEGQEGVSVFKDLCTEFACSCGVPPPPLFTGLLALLIGHPLDESPGWHRT